MKRQVISAVVSLLLLFSIFSPVLADEARIQVVFNEETMDFGDHQPFIEKGTTLVPARPLFQQLNLDIEWDDDTRSVIGNKNGLTITLQMDNPSAIVNGEAKELPVAPKLINSVSYVPVRFVSEEAGYVVSWFDATRTVIIESTTEEQVEEGSRGFLWKVEHGENTVYMLGSIHVAHDSMYPLHSRIMNAFDESHYLVVEADVSSISEEESQQWVLEHGFFTDGSTLQDHISAETYELLSKVLTSLGLNETTFDTMKPWLVGSSLSLLQFMMVGFEPSLGIDMYFLENAKQREMPILELESAEFQLKMFDEMPMEVQELLLLETLESFENVDEAIFGLMEMWISGDDQLLAELINPSEQYEEYNKIILDDRNILMAEKIKGYLHSTEPSTYFVVVGAAHFPGEMGIVQLLKDQGFDVVRIN